MITDDKKSILERVNFFCAFFIWSDPGGDDEHGKNDGDDWGEKGG